jgi:hypothetical protein
MESHSCNFKAREIVWLIVPILLSISVFAAVMHAGARLNVFPKPRPTLDIDRTILVHQADAARTTQDARVVLIGDSSCLMDVSARNLSEQVHESTLNLGTFSYLGLRDYARLLQAHFASTAESRKIIILLMHPEALRRPAPDARYGQMISDYFNGVDHCETATFYHCLCCGLGLEIIRGRFVTRILPQPLRDRYGDLYGFTSGLDRRLTEQRGSLIDMEPKPFSGNAEYRLANSLEMQSRTFRAVLPNGAKLLVGITPVPDTFAPAGYAEQFQSMLRQWSQWLQADVALTNLSSTMPDRFFSKVTHLNAEGVLAYTEQVGRSIAPHLGQKE